MRASDSRSRDGFVIAQDHRKPGGDDGVSQLDTRGGMYAVRVTDRKRPIGQWIIDRDAVGDLYGASLWPQDGDKRPVPAWRYIFPATPSSTQTTGSGGGSGGGQTTPSGGGGGPITPGGAIPPDSRPPTQITPGGGNTTNDPPSPPPILTAIETQESGAPMPPIPVSGALATFPSSKMLPVRGTDWGPDTRFKTKDFGGGSGLAVGPSDSDPRNLPAGWPAIPGGSMTLVTATMDEDRQIETLHYTDPRICAPCVDGETAYGTPVCDMKGDSFDPERQAPIQSLARVVRQPTGSDALAGNQRNSLALNIGPAGLKDVVGGIWADGTSRKSMTLGMPSVRTGGFADCVQAGCKHSFGKDGDGNQISPVHLSWTSLFRSNPTKNGTFDGPLAFAVEWPAPPDLSFAVRVHIGWNPDVKYGLPRDKPSKTYTGGWDFWTTTAIGSNDGDDDGDGGTPGGDPGDDGGGTPPGDPGPPPTTGGGGTGGGGVPGTGGGTPPGGGGGGGGTPGGGGQGTGGGKFTFTSAADLGSPDRVPSPFDQTGRKATYKGRTFLAGSSLLLEARRHAAAVSEVAVTSLVGHAQHVRAGGPDLRFGLGARGEETARALRTMPQAVRIEAFARQNGNGFDYTQPPGASRSLSGTGDGGLMVLPPEVDASDLLDASDPLRLSDTGFARSSSVVVFTPGTSIGFGLPSLSTGGAVKGVTMTSVIGDEAMKFVHVDGTGAEQVIVQLAANEAEFADDFSFVVGTGTGLKIGTGPTQKVGFYGASPVPRPSSTGTATGFTAGAGTTVTDESTFTGGTGSTAYRLSDIVKALKDLGLLAP